MTRFVLLLPALGLLSACAKHQSPPVTFRALVTSLDSAVLEDTATIRPMNLEDPLDTVMLAMVKFLDREIGPGHDVRDTRVRHWDGHGTQAHPTLGILVDSAEVAGLLDTVISYKGQANVAREKINQRLPYVARFLIAHEYAHLLQYRSLDHDSVANWNATRIIECGADLLGGMMYAGYLAATYGDHLPEAAAETAIDFGYVVGAKDWLDGTTHPMPEDRRQCIRRGVEVGRGSAGWLEENEPELHRKALALIPWSQMRSRAIVSEQSVVDSSAVLAVVRDSSTERLVRRLAAPTAAGSVALRRFRGAAAPGGDYLLREALPGPWKCVTGEVDGSEMARCSRIDRNSGFFSDFTNLVLAVKAGLKGTRWREVHGRSEPEEAEWDDGVREFVAGEREILQSATFAEKGSDPADPRSARIEVVQDRDLASESAQLPPESMMSLVFRAKR